MVRISADDKASDVIKGVGDKASKVASAIGTGLKVAGAAAAAGTALIAKGALDMYSSYEQNLGGIQKIFGNMGKSLEDYAALTGQTVDAAADKWQRLEVAQNTMLANASAAWQTAGLSASAYMEQSTSFGAALVASLGGDTQKAAEYANTAIIDMADNANTFGTSIQDIQNAYQGFAKQNYTMLDNLKLGYGGTQSEMKRLINDASKLTDVQKRLGVTVDSSSMSFDNIVAAIHVMQYEMNVGGTTAREAATTIEGSVNAMRAAWDNWLTGLASDDADMSALTENLTEAFGNVANNVIPRISQIASTMVTEMPGVVAQVAPAIVEAVGGFIGPISETVSSLMGQIAQQVLDSGPDVGNALLEGVLSFDFSGFGEAASRMVAALVSWLGDNVDSLINAAGQMVAGLIEGISEHSEEVVQGVIDLVLAVGQALVDNLPMLLEAASTLFGAILQALVEKSPDIIMGLTTILNDLIDAVAAWALQMLGQAIQAAANFVQGLVGGLMTLPGQVQGWLAGVISTVAGWVSQFGSNATRAASEFGNRLRDGLASIPGTLGNIGSNIINGIVNGITGAADRVKDAVGNAIGNAIDFAKHILGIASPSKVFKRYGYFVMKGMELGISQNAGLPLNATEEAMRAVADVEPVSPTAPYMQAASASGQVLDWLQSNLGDVIAEFTPVMGESEFGRKARKAVAYA